MKQTINNYWKQFLIEKNLPKKMNYYETFYFGSNETSATNLLKLVLEGKKVATCSAKMDYILQAEALPKTNDYSIVTNFSKEPKCIIQTTDVLTLPFKKMTFDICQFEGEDTTLASWQEKHIDFFTHTGKKFGYDFSWDMEIVFEFFNVVYQ